MHGGRDNRRVLVQMGLERRWEIMHPGLAVCTSPKHCCNSKGCEGYIDWFPNQDSHNFADEFLVHSTRDVVEISNQDSHDVVDSTHYLINSEDFIQ